MAKHIAQYFFLALLFIALVLASGQKCFPSDCKDPSTCNESCIAIGKGNKQGYCFFGICCCDYD
ncbi:hypothetical protein MtrunA17_Chr7g0237971 [Medicago truncatula]|uniref:LCR-like protein n=1 Tax=Medicago truncatula TaxID=3880 RepID=A0A072U0C5_MEDTR|nr:LCR-like protein [Medicago truncatula]RHN46042.1 hypothetical protein MtrunA17_Chr7g0237971 [Medicago truncatula]